MANGAMSASITSVVKLGKWLVHQVDITGMHFYTVRCPFVITNTKYIVDKFIKQSFVLNALSPIHMCN